MALGLVVIVAAAVAVAFVFGRLHRGEPRLLYAGGGGVWERVLATGRERRLASIPRDAVVAVPSPDGRWLAYLRRGGALWLLDLEGGRRDELADRLAVPVGWTPDGRLEAEELSPGGARGLEPVVAIDLAGPTRVLLPRGYARRSVIVWPARDRALVSVAGAGGEVVLVEIRLSASAPVVQEVARGVEALALSVDGRELLYEDGGGVGVARISGDRLVHRRRLLAAEAHVAAASPEGYVAWSGRTLGPRPEEGTWVLEGGRARRVADGAAELLAWMPRGRGLLYERGGVVWALLHAFRPRRVSRAGVSVVGFAAIG